jgi:hypothetical protein
VTDAFGDGAWFTRGEQGLWQRRAAAQLTAILAAHQNLPAIAWTVAAAGCTLAGHVDTLAPSGQARATFAGWRAALGLDGEVREHLDSGGTAHLHAMAERHRVRVRLTATVFDEPVRS